MKTSYQIAQKMIDRAIAAVDPYKLLINKLKFEGERLIVADHTELDLSDIRQIKLVGFGKGVAPMAAAVEEILSDRLQSGKIVVKYGHGLDLQKTTVFEAAHPIPDANTLAAAASILASLQDLDKEDLIIVVISGGGSALFELLPEDIKLADLEELSRQLLGSGAHIGEINIVRKHISLVKGGRLAQAIAPARGLALILSDVIGDPLSSIASGPTAPDDSTFTDALHILEKYDILQTVPKAIKTRLEAGIKGELSETPKPGEVLFDKITNIIVGNNRLALHEAGATARADGLNVQMLTDRMTGEAREIAKVVAAIIKSAQETGEPVADPGCLLFGGEPTVTLRGKGKGGRNQELALATMIAMGSGAKPFYFCSVGTDGTDGPTDAAGAWVDEQTIEKARSHGLNPDDYLENNDAYHFFEAIDQLIKTGPTRTNVMDIAFFII